MTASPCEDCGLFRVVMVGMEPGEDGVPWQLCSSCWSTTIASAARSIPKASSGATTHTGDLDLTPRVTT